MAVAALVVTVVGPSPVSAAELANTSISCIGTMTLSFSAAVGPLPSMTPFTVSGSGNCLGLGGGPVTWGSTTSLLTVDADCEAIVAIGAGSIALPSGTVPVTMVGVGPALLQSWTFVDTASVGGLEATGAFAWVNPPQTTACLLTGITSMTLTGAFVVVQ